jgi:hypothetical protein
MPLTKRSRKILGNKVFLTIFLDDRRIRIHEAQKHTDQDPQHCIYGKCAELIDLDYNLVVQANLCGVCGGPRGERTSRGAGTQRGLFCQVGEQLGLGVGNIWGSGKAAVGAQGRQQLGLRVGDQLGSG